MTHVGRMLTFATDGERFTLRVAGVCLHDGHVLLHRAVEADFWVLPGGRVHHDEASAEAIGRELREELASEVIVERLVWVAENFFYSLGERHHEIGLYFLYSLPPGSPWLAVDRDHIGREGEVDLVYRWFPVTELPEVELFPRFLRQALARIPAGIEQIVQRDDEATSAIP